MFGKNQIEKQKLGDGQTLRIVAGSPWITIQGEGPYAGHPAIFIRLHGCNLRCTFCDTNFDDPENPRITLFSLLEMVEALPPATLCVITGGEPTNQQIIPLCKELGWAGFKVQIETAGINWIEDLDQHCEIICSPKTSSIHPMIFKHAKAFKYVISASQKFESFIPIAATQPGTRPTQLATPRPGAPVYLSPMDEYNEEKNKNNRVLVGELAILYGCIAGLQIHKFLGQD